MGENAEGKMGYRAEEIKRRDKRSNCNNINKIYLKYSNFSAYLFKHFLIFTLNIIFILNRIYLGLLME